MSLSGTPPRGIKNYLRNLGSRAGAAAGYAGRAFNRATQRMQGYKTAEEGYQAAIKAARNRQQMLMNRAGVNAGPLSAANTALYGNSLTKTRSQLEAERKKMMANRIAGMKKRVTNTLGSWRNKIKAGFGRTKNVIQNLLAGKLGRSSRQRNLNWAAYRGQQAAKLEGSLEWAQQADKEATARTDAVNAFFGAAWLMITEGAGAVKKFFEGVIEYIRKLLPPAPSRDDVEQAFVKAKDTLIAAPGKIKRFAEDSCEYIEKQTETAMNNLRKTLVWMGLSEKTADAIINGMKSIGSAIRSGAVAAGNFIASIGGKISATLGAAYRAMKDLNESNRKAFCAYMCGSIKNTSAPALNKINMSTHPIFGTKSNNSGSPSTSNPGSPSVKQLVNAIEKKSRRSSRRGNRRNRRNQH